MDEAGSNLDTIIEESTKTLFLIQVKSPSRVWGYDIHMIYPKSFQQDDCVPVKSVSIRIEEEMLRKIAYTADYEGRSVNSQVLGLS